MNIWYKIVGSGGCSSKVFKRKGRTEASQVPSSAAGSSLLPAAHDLAPRQQDHSAWPSAGTCIAWHPICHMRRVSTSANGWCSRQSLQQSASSSLLSSWVAPWSLTIFKTSSFYGLLQLFEGTISNGISCTPASGFPESVLGLWVTLRRLRGPRGGPTSRLAIWGNLGGEICARTCTANPMFLVRLVASIIFS